MLRFMTVDHQWQKVFPNKCSVSGDRKAYRCNAEKVKNMETDSARKLAAEWYSDWRVDKDLTLYDNLLTTAEDQPILASMTLWRRSEPALPNDTYGKNMFVLDHGKVNLTNAMVTCGDKGVPRRSMLLVLHDLLCSTKNKFGEPWSNLSQRGKFRTFERLLLHLVDSEKDGADLQSWKDLIETRYTDTVKFTDKVDPRKFMPSLKERMNLELHVMAPTLLRDAKGILLCKKLDLASEERPKWEDTDVQADIQSFKTGLPVPKPDVLTYEFESKDFDGLTGRGPTCLALIVYQLLTGDISSEEYQPLLDMLKRESAFNGDDPV